VCGHEGRTWFPKVTHAPKLSTDTSSPVRPRCRYSMSDCGGWGL